MKLIDADKFLDFIKSELKQDRTDEKHLENIICVLENLPTAYDVEKVVSELEDYKMWKELLIYDLDFRERQIIKKAIDLVKAGGVDE